MLVKTLVNVKTLCEYTEHRHMHHMLLTFILVWEVNTLKASKRFRLGFKQYWHHVWSGEISKGNFQKGPLSQVRNLCHYHPYLAAYYISRFLLKTLSISIRIHTVIAMVIPGNVTVPLFVLYDLDIGYTYKELWLGLKVESDSLLPIEVFSIHVYTF